MNGYKTSTYGDRIAEVYDEVHSTRDVSGRVGRSEEVAAAGQAPQHD